MARREEKKKPFASTPHVSVCVCVCVCASAERRHKHTLAYSWSAHLLAPPPSAAEGHAPWPG